MLDIIYDFNYVHKLNIYVNVNVSRYISIQQVFILLFVSMRRCSSHNN